MYHSITFFELDADLGDPAKPNSVNTWATWHLIPSSRPLVNPPVVNTNYVEIPGVSGALDLTEVLASAPTYKNRTGSWEFIVVNGHTPWDSAYSNIMDYLHGKQKLVILEDDRAWYYIGRLSVNSWKSDKQYSLITIDYTLEPYKKAVQIPGEPWLWDPFDFVFGDIEENDTNTFVLEQNRTVEIKVNPGSIRVNPDAYVYAITPGTESGLNLSISKVNTDGTTTFIGQFKAGKNINPNLIIGPGETTFKVASFTYPSKLVISYRKERL